MVTRSPESQVSVSQRPTTSVAIPRTTTQPPDTRHFHMPPAPLSAPVQRAGLKHPSGADPAPITPRVIIYRSRAADVPRRRDGRDYRTSWPASAVTTPPRRAAPCGPSSIGRSATGYWRRRARCSARRTRQAPRTMPRALEARCSRSPPQCALAPRLGQASRFPIAYRAAVENAEHLNCTLFRSVGAG